MLRRFELLKQLSATHAISGTALAQVLGISRAAVWQQVERLRRDGLSILADERGYRLETPFEPLDVAVIRSRLEAFRPEMPVALTVHEVTGSTNDDLIARWSAGGSVHGQVVLAEYQRAGRGRRGGRWLAAPGAGLCLSVGYTFEQTPADIATAGLVAGLAARRAIARECGVVPQLKWPNDLMLDGAKLGGVLTELRAELQGASSLVIGVGINIGPAAQLSRDAGQPVADLSTAGSAPDRNLIAAAFIAELLDLLGKLAADGFASMMSEWTEADCLRGEWVKVTPEPGPWVATVLEARSADGPEGVHGEVLGIGPDGGLRLLTEAGPRTLYSGHVLRTGVTSLAG